MRILRHGLVARPQLSALGWKLVDAVDQRPADFGDGHAAVMTQAVRIPPFCREDGTHPASGRNNARQAGTTRMPRVEIGVHAGKQRLPGLGLDVITQ